MPFPRKFTLSSHINKEINTEDYSKSLFLLEAHKQLITQPVGEMPSMPSWTGRLFCFAKNSFVHRDFRVMRLTDQWSDFGSFVYEAIPAILIPKHINQGSTDKR